MMNLQRSSACMAGVNRDGRIGEENPSPGHSPGGLSLGWQTCQVAVLHPTETNVWHKPVGQFVCVMVFYLPLRCTDFKFQLIWVGKKSVT